MLKIAGQKVEKEEGGYIGLSKLVLQPKCTMARPLEDGVAELFILMKALNFLFLICFFHQKT